MDRKIKMQNIDIDIIMVTTNQKPTVDTQKRVKNPSITLIIAIKTQWKTAKEEERKRKLQNQSQNN